MAPKSADFLQSASTLQALLSQLFVKYSLTSLNQAGTLFRSLTMFCGVGSILRNISYIQAKYGEYPANIVSPT
jgi:hypothetical protein